MLTRGYYLILVVSYTMSITSFRLRKRLLESSVSLSPLWFCCCSVAKLCLTPCNPIDCSMPGFPAAAAAAAKSLQSCPTLCDPIDGSPPGSPIPGILQARTLEWVAISSSNTWRWKVKVKSLSHVRPSATPWTAAFQAPPSMGFSRQEYWSGVPLPSPARLPYPSLSPGFSSDSCPLSWWCSLTISSFATLFSFAFNLSQHHGLFQESALWVRWPKCWSFSFSISPSNEYSGLIFFRIDRSDLLLAVQGTLKSLLQHNNLKVSILQCSTILVVQLSHPYKTTGKTIALTRRTFVGKVMSLLLNSRDRKESGMTERLNWN